jgi:hypothetical protein
MLKNRLIRRGLAISVALLALPTVVSQAHAAVPAAIAAAMTSSAVSCVQGVALASFASPGATVLVESMVRGLWLKKAVTTLAICLGFIGIGTRVGIGLQSDAGSSIDRRATAADTATASASPAQASRPVDSTLPRAAEEVPNHNELQEHKTLVIGVFVAGNWDDDNLASIQDKVHARFRSATKVVVIEQSRHTTGLSHRGQFDDRESGEWTLSLPKGSTRSAETSTTARRVIASKFRVLIITEKSTSNSSNGPARIIVFAPTGTKESVN